MAAEEKVVIKVEIDADIDKDLLALERRIKALEDRQASFNRVADDTDTKLKSIAKSSSDIDDKLKKVDKSTNSNSKNFSVFGKSLQSAIPVLTKFAATLAKIGLIATSGQIALFTAGVLAAKLALVAGRLSAQGFQIALKGVSVAAAAVATGIAVAAAAIRQFQEAQLSPFLGGGTKGLTSARAFTRGVSSQMSGLLGGEATTAIIGSLARSGIQGRQANALITQMYNLTGGDAKATQSLAAAMAGGDLKEAISATEGAAGFKKGSLGGVSSMDQLMSKISSGAATSEAFAGLSDVMASTFIGTLKTEFSGMKTIFADLGDQLVNPFQQAFMQIGKILKEDVLSMTAIIQKFGADSMAPTLVSVVDKVSEFIRSNVISHVENVSTLSQSFVDFFKKMKSFASGVADALRSVEPAANVIIDMFKAGYDAGKGRGLFSSFTKSITENASELQSFGTSIGNVVGSLFDYLFSSQSGFFAKLPMFTKILNTIASELIPAIGKFQAALTPLLNALPNIIEGMASVLEMLAPVVEQITKAVAALLNVLPGPLAFITGVGMYGGYKSMGRTLQNPKGKQELYGKVGSGFSAVGAGLFNMFGRRPTLPLDELTGKPMGPMPKPVGRFDSLKGGAKKAITSPDARLLGGMAVLSSGASAYKSDELSYGSILSAAIGGAIAAKSPFGLLAGLIPVATNIVGKNKRATATDKAISSYLKDTSRSDLSKKSFEDVQGMQADELAKAAKMQAAYSKTREALDKQLADFVKYEKAKSGETYVDNIGKAVKSKEFDALAGYLKEMKIVGEDVSKEAIWKRLPELMRDSDNQVNNLNKSMANYEKILSGLSDKFDVSKDDIIAFGEALNLDFLTPDKYSMKGLETLFQLYKSPTIDRTMMFSPDLSKSPLGKAELNATANATLDALISASKSGTVDTNILGDFLSSFAQMEVAMGASPDVAFLSAIQEIREKVLEGAFPPSFLEQIGAKGLETDVLNQMAEKYGLNANVLEGKYRLPSGGVDVTRVDAFLADAAKTRTALQKGVLSNDWKALQGGVSAEGFGGFASFVEGKIMQKIGPSADPELLASVSTASADSLKAAAEEILGKDDTSRLMTEYLTTISSETGVQNALLSQIVANTAAGIKINITGNMSYTAERVSSYGYAGYNSDTVRPNSSGEAPLWG